MSGALTGRIRLLPAHPANVGLGSPRIYTADRHSKSTGRTHSFAFSPSPLRQRQEKQKSSQQPVKRAQADQENPRPHCHPSTLCPAQSPLPSSRHPRAAAPGVLFSDPLPMAQDPLQALELWEQVCAQVLCVPCS